MYSAGGMPKVASVKTCGSVASATCAAMEIIALVIHHSSEEGLRGVQAWLLVPVHRAPIQAPALARTARQEIAEPG
jgi:hypothetical protein